MNLAYMPSCMQARSQVLRFRGRRALFLSCV